MAGLIGNVLCAKRNITNYFFGIANVSLYAYIAWTNRIYGDVALNVLYYLPMQFVGFYSWYRSQRKAAILSDASETSSDKDTSAVKSKTLTNKQRLMVGALLAIGITAVALILKNFTNDPQPLKDSATTCRLKSFLYFCTPIEIWCNGSTTVFGAVCPGSNPGISTKKGDQSITLFSSNQ